MPLSFDQFKQLRSQGLSVDQIRRFEAGGKPQIDYSKRAFNPKNPNYQENMQSRGETQSTAANLLKVATGDKPYLDPKKTFGIGLGILKEMGRPGATVLDQTAGRLANVITGRGNKPDNFADKLRPTNTEEKIGSIAGKVAQGYMLSSILSPVYSGIDNVIKGKGFLPSIGRVFGKAGVEGVSQGSLAAMQEQDAKAGLAAGLTGGLLRGAGAAIGEFSRASRLPERFASQIFKDQAPSIEDRYRTLARAREAAKTGKAIELPKSLARKALDANLPTGSLDDMGTELAKRLDQSETAVKAIAKTAKDQIGLEPQYGEVLRQIQGRYKNVGLGSIGQKAKELADSIQNGKANAETALKIRRFLDGFRLTSSFDTNRPVSLAQEGLKELTDNLRGRLARVPGMETAMASYKDQIDLLEAVAKEAARTGNNQVFGLIDSVLIAGEPASSLGLFATRRVANSAAGKMGLAKLFDRAGNRPLRLGQLLTSLSSSLGRKDQE